MKPFHFRLQTKLDISCREEQQAREGLQISIVHRDQVQNELDKILLQTQEVEAGIKAMMQSGFDMQQFLIRKDYLPVLRTLRLSKEEELIKAESMVVEARNLLLEKMKESKTLNKLRDKEWAKYLQELNQEEQKTIDELAINSHFRRQGDGSFAF